MNNNTKVTISCIRIALGWIFLYAGISKILNPEWSAAGYLKIAKTAPGLFAWFANSSNIGWVNFLNEWGLTLIGVSLLLGILVRFASYAGILMMVLYYFPILQFPKVGNNAFIIDEHIIYILIFGLLIASEAGKHWGLEDKIVKFR